MSQNGWTDEQRELAEIEIREQERFDQAYDEYSAHVARAPIPSHFDTTEDYEAALEEWAEIAQELRDHAEALAI